jgi:hypothetical protein
MPPQWFAPDHPSTGGNTSFRYGKEEKMAKQHAAAKIEPEVAEHITAAMDEQSMPGPATIAVTTAMAGEQHWPDGNGKRRHPKDRGTAHSQVGNDAAVTAVHRTGRPQMPHSS